METEKLVVLIVTALFGISILVDIADDLFLGNRWEGVSDKFFALMGSMILALLTRKVLKKNESGGKSEES